MKSLTVYKASAGSGKTFTLATEYIKLLIDNPSCFKNILAVTFTNKATEEMKIRILSQLYGIWKKLPDSEAYTNVITSELGISMDKAAYQAGIALKLLIHNYNYFRVETIDSFFQSILRNLAKELDLTANLRISLNDNEVEEQAVDLLIESLNTTSIMLKWLIEYIFSNIEENKSWKVIDEIKSFGKTIFQDFYKQNGEEVGKKLADPNFWEQYTKQLKTLRDEAKNKMSSYAETFFAEVNDAGLSTNSFTNNEKGICSYFNKIRNLKFSNKDCINNTLKKHLEDSNNWVTKKNPDRERIISVVDSRLMKLLKDAEAERPKLWEMYASANATIRNLNKLRLLNNIEAKVRALNNEADRFLLSDTQYLLNKLIKDNDTPFIFEKAGCQLKHIMIDEFQDTGSVQWKNFKVLLKECMSSHDENDRTIGNLIVGDVKQSIYRWRSGDWRLLNNIEEQFDNPEKNMEIRSLQTNYRSERNIVEFNNKFFKLAVKNEYEKETEISQQEKASELLVAYKDVEQCVKNGKQPNGLVRISLINSEDYNETMLKNIECNIDELISAGIKLNEIALLIRYNKHIPLIAKHFMENRPDIKIVSDEAFRLDASVAVNTIIFALRLLENPDDILTKATLTKFYQKYVLSSDNNYNDFLTDIANGNTASDTYLPANYINCMKDLAEKPLSDIIEEIYTLFQLDNLENQGAYICSFYDAVAEFTSNKSGTIHDFLDEWNNNICIKTIQSDEIDGIRLISIHKSKGLEFDNVIIPYCDWSLESSQTTLWCNTQKTPFNQLPLIPIKSGVNLLETIYAEDYRNEHIQNTVDNLNLLYVAFTRASKNLFVLGKRNKSTGRTNNRSEILLKCVKELNDELENSSLIGYDDEKSNILFEYGQLYVKEQADFNNQSNNVFLKPEAQYNIKFEVSNKNVEFIQSNKSNDFISGKDDSDDTSRYIKKGNLLHKLFSMIHTTGDIDKVLKQFEFDGIIYDDDFTADELKDFLHKRLSDRRVSEWFAPHWHVFNECNILFATNENGKTVITERRPDRVITNGNEIKVIDFKFGKPNPIYSIQIREYINLLISMGYKNVKGYLWFVYSNKIEEVNNP